MYLLLFTTRLQSGGFANSLAKKRPTTKEELIERIRKYIDLEGFRATHKEIEHGFQEANQSRKVDRPVRNQAEEEGQQHLKGEGYRDRFRGEFTPLNTSRAHIFKEVMNTKMWNVQRPPPIRSIFAQMDKSKWCEFHRCYGHLTIECFNLKDAIEQLIREGRLQRYVKRGNRGQDNCREGEKSRKRSDKSRSPDRDEQKKARKEQVKETTSSPSNHVEHDKVCTIAGGQAGGGETSNARKKHLKAYMAISERSRFKGE